LVQMQPKKDTSSTQEDNRRQYTVHQGVRRIAFKGRLLKIFTFPISIRSY